MLWRDEGSFNNASSVKSDGASLLLGLSSENGKTQHSEADIEPEDKAEKHSIGSLFKYLLYRSDLSIA